MNIRVENFSIYDTHAHYDDRRFGETAEEVLARMPREGVGAVINNAVNLDASAKRCIELAEKFPFVYAAVGVYPEYPEKGEAVDIEKLEKLLSHEKVVAIGEIGLDYYWSKNNKENQKLQFERQIELANKLEKPVIVHDREAHEDTLSILKKHKPKGAVHCFSGSVEMAKEIVSLGMYLGIGGVVTYNNAKKLVKVVKEIPLESILLETDAPYLAPVPKRGETNLSSYLVFVAEKIAEIKGVNLQEVLSVTKQNAKKLYKI